MGKVISRLQKERSKLQTAHKLLPLLLKLGLVLPIQQKIVHVLEDVELAVHATVTICENVLESRAVAHTLGHYRE